MLCPFCGYMSSKVLESRSTAEKSSIRRRRECENCQKRFTTYEKIELAPVLVNKRNGAREEYCREKIYNSIIRACNKCDVSTNLIEAIIDRIELEFSISGKREVNSNYLGERILDSLRDINEIAYIRYASFFKRFNTLDELLEEISTLNRRTSLV